MQVAQDHIIGGIGFAVGFLSLWWIFWGKKWYRKVRRRRGGVYLWTTRRHHLRPRWLRWLGLREVAYVGETVSFYFRKQQHLGVSYYPADGPRGSALTKVPAQPWSDLDPVMYKVIRLPWWLCWKWVLRPLETLVILLTWPRYNMAKNRWNPRRITKTQAQLQRAARDRVRAVWGVRSR